MLTGSAPTNPLVRGAEDTGSRKGLLWPRQGEVWQVNLGETSGSEMQKTRPAVVINADGVKSYGLRLVAPITTWKSERDGMNWHTLVMPSAGNGLKQPSSIDAMNVRSVDLERFVRRIGRLSAQELSDVRGSVMMVIQEV